MSHPHGDLSINSGTGPYSPYGVKNLVWPSSPKAKPAGSSTVKGYYKLRNAAGETDSDAEGFSSSDTGSSVSSPNSASPLLPSSEYIEPPFFYIPRRYIMSGLLFMVIMIGYAIRVVMSVTVDYMAAGTYWETKQTTQSLVLCCFFVGYITTQIISGECARKFGPKLTYIVFFSLTALSTILLPLAGSSLPMIMSMRVLAGIGEGVLFPGTHAVVSYWIPPKERATLLTIIWSGQQVGTITALATTEIICKQLGWQYVYYIWGGIGAVWVLVWMLFAIDSPLSRQKGQGCAAFKISRLEVEMLVAEIPALSAPDQPTPWKRLLGTMATWAIVAGHFSGSWIGYVLLTYLPKFLKSLHYAVGSYGLIPYAVTIVVTVIAGKLADVAINRLKWPVVWVRRIWQMIGSSAYLIGLSLVASLVKSQKQGVLAICLLSYAMSVGGFIASGYGANHIDIGPKYAGPLMGITNTAATIPGIVGVFLTGFILDQTGGSYFWVWMLAMAISGIGTAIFCIFAKGKKIFD